MAFWGHAFIFNEIPCEDYDLMMYDIEGNTQSAGTFANSPTIVEEVLPRRVRPLFYGVRRESKLQFSIVFGVNQRRIDNQEYLSRYELEAIAFWLTGHEEYLWLAIEQEDMSYVRYRCIISSLDIVEYGNIPWALKATITCDSAYAYLYPQDFSYEINGDTDIVFYNESSDNGYYYPLLTYDTNRGGNFSIINHSDNEREFAFVDVPTSIKSIGVDNENMIITNDQDLNVYDNFNFNFFRLVKGENYLTVKGNGILTLRCEFPINIGG